MTEKAINHKERASRRALGVHLTSIEIFLDYIAPEVKNILENHVWVDLYCGEGNLILPILKFIPEDKRDEFFKEHIFLFDVQAEMVEKCINNAIEYNIPEDIAKKNIRQRDSLERFPVGLKKRELPIFHITNPPYLYLGYIRKHEETKRHFKYFENENKGYQDLYQIAMMNDLRNNVNNMVYIIPSNFLFGASVSNKFREDFLPYYKINKIFIFETKVFKFTGTNICIVFFERKMYPKNESLKFKGLKIKKNDKILERDYNLKPEWKYRAGTEFDEFARNLKAHIPLKVKYYLLHSDVEKNLGSLNIRVIDTNAYVANNYNREDLKVNKNLKNRVISNILYARTVDTGKYDGRVGLYEIKESFNVDGIYVSKATYRTSPIQIFLEPIISFDDQILLKEFFNLILEHFRKELDSEFMTTYKYSNAEYTRKYLGLTQVRKLIETYPSLNLKEERREILKELISKKKITEIIEFLSNKSNPKLRTEQKKKKNLDITNWF